MDISMPKYFTLSDAKYYRIIGENKRDRITGKNKDGDPVYKQPDIPLAMKQNALLRTACINLGLKGLYIPSREDLQSVHYLANIFIASPNRKEIVMSNMKLDTRKKEPAYVRGHLSKLLPDYIFHSLPEKAEDGTPLTFEGCGDWSRALKHDFVGVGQRTTPEAILEVKKLLHLKKPLRFLTLANEYFYHLDTCFLSLQKTNSIVYYPGAFSRISLDMLRLQKDYQQFEVNENLAYYGVCNSICLGEYVLLTVPFRHISNISYQKSMAAEPIKTENDIRYKETITQGPEYKDLIKFLWDCGYSIIPAYTSEYDLDGAGPFCNSNFIYL